MMKRIICLIIGVYMLFAVCMEGAVRVNAQDGNTFTDTQADTAIDTPDNIYSYFDLVGEDKDISTDTATDSASIPLSEGTYKVTSEEGAALHINANPESTVTAKLPLNTYHVVKAVKNDFGYITYKDKSGWVKLWKNTKGYNPMGEEFTTAANKAYEALQNISEIEQYNNELALQLEESLKSMDEMFLSGSDYEAFKTAHEELASSNSTVDKMFEFVKNPQGQYKSEFRFYGDANGDGEVNMLDVVYIQKFIAKMVTFSTLEVNSSDVSTDGEVNMGDVVTIQRYLAKLFERLPTGMLFHINN